MTNSSIKPNLPFFAIENVERPTCLSCDGWGYYSDGWGYYSDGWGYYSNCPTHSIFYEGSICENCVGTGLDPIPLSEIL